MSVPAVYRVQRQTLSEILNSRAMRLHGAPHTGDVKGHEWQDERTYRFYVYVPSAILIRSAGAGAQNDRRRERSDVDTMQIDGTGRQCISPPLRGTLFEYIYWPRGGGGGEGAASVAIFLFGIIPKKESPTELFVVVVACLLLLLLLVGQWKREKRLCTVVQQHFTFWD